MKQKLFVAVLFTTFLAIGCKSRFTSTADSTGPRRHDHADVSPAAEVDPTQQAGHADPSITEIRDSANQAPILTKADSTSALSD